MNIYDIFDNNNNGEQSPLKNNFPSYTQQNIPWNDVNTNRDNKPPSLLAPQNIHSRLQELGKRISQELKNNIETFSSYSIFLWQLQQEEEGREEDNLCSDHHN